MPIPYENLTFKQLLKHKLAYECINTKGAEIIDKWDIKSFEMAILTEQAVPFDISPEQMAELKNACAPINEFMPYLGYAEHGQHYGYQLFSYDAYEWMTEAAPLYWAYLSREFTMDMLPMDDAYLREKYMRIAKEMKIPRDPKREVYCMKFAVEDMSNGIICSDFVISQLKVLKERNRVFQYRNENSTLEIRYMNRAIERIDHLCGYYSSKMKYRCNPNLGQEELLFALESSETHRGYEVVSFLWGLFTGEPLNYVQAAQKLGVSDNYVRQTEHHAFRKISRYTDLLLVKNE